tara:strand:+ start:403 stop:513 length:111 start_codon:yes stop_codon:yes gene_type:complete
VINEVNESGDTKSEKTGDVTLKLYDNALYVEQNDEI